MPGPRNVLIVEDDRDVSEALGETLADAGYAVSTASNGAVALRALQSSSELPCLILLDLMMPVMDGESFLLELRKDTRLAGLPVVLFSASGRPFTKVSELGVQGELRKPVVMDELLSTVSRFVPSSGEGE